MEKYILVVKGFEGIEDWTDSISAISLEDAINKFSECLDIPREIIEKCVSKLNK